MKKIITIAATLLLAVCAQAGSIDWSVSGANPIKNQLLGPIGQNVTVYLVLSSSQATIETAIATAGPTGFSLSTSGVLGTALTTASSGVAPGTYAQSDQILAGSSYIFKVLVFDTPTAYTGSGSGYYKFSTDSLVTIANVDGEHTQFVTFGASNFSGASWTSYTVVPEPTSMALLAFGVAAVGLRRRFKK